MSGCVSEDRQRPVDGVAIHVQMRHRPNLRGAGVEHQQATFLEPAGKLRRGSAGRIDVEKDQVRVGYLRIEPQLVDLADALGQPPGVGMVVGQPVDVIVQGKKSTGGNHARLPHPSAEHLAMPDPLGNQLLRTRRQFTRKSAQ